jgi:hypothetical protein
MAIQDKSVRIAFLEAAWEALLHDQPELFKKPLLADYVSSEVMDVLPEHTTLKNVLMECHSRGTFEESYIKFFLGLTKRWDSLMPESRQMIMEQLNGLELRANGNLRRQFQLHADDAAALTIPWETADRLYAGVRELTFNVCQKAGLELRQPRGMSRQQTDFSSLLQRGSAMLLALLRERINIDKTAALMAVGHATPVAKPRMLNNLNRAYVDCLDAFRGGLLHWSMQNLQESSAIELFKGVRHAALLTPPIPEHVMRDCIEELLEPFIEEFTGMSALLDESPPDPASYEKVRRLFSSAARVPMQSHAA